MTNLLEPILSIPPPFNMVVMIVLIFAVAGVITSVTKQIRKFACHRQEIDFKRELLDRGLSIEEIERLSEIHPSRQSDS